MLQRFEVLSGNVDIGRRGCAVTSPPTTLTPPALPAKDIDALAIAAPRSNSGLRKQTTKAARSGDTANELIEAR
jgi:hypothetical protein